MNKTLKNRIMKKVLIYLNNSNEKETLWLFKSTIDREFYGGLAKKLKEEYMLIDEISLPNHSFIPFKLKLKKYNVQLKNDKYVLITVDSIDSIDVIKDLLKS